jgi:hypothetical protein
VIRKARGAIAGDAPPCQRSRRSHYPLHGTGRSRRRSPDRNSIPNVPGSICRSIVKAKGVNQIPNQTPSARAIAPRTAPGVGGAISAVVGGSKRVFWRLGTVIP